MLLRWVQMSGLLCVAAFFTLVAFGNVTDYGSNFAFVQHVLSMDTTFKSPSLMWRAITAPWAHHLAYLAIIVWQTATAVVAWGGLVRMATARNDDAASFERAKRLGVVACAAAFFLYFFGFVVIGGEWFAMWQSKVWNGQAAAFRFAVLSGLVMLLLVHRDRAGAP